MKFDRRSFLKTMAVLGGPSALGLSPIMLTVQKAMADTASDPTARFVLIRVHGAMDSTLGLHPYLTSKSGIDDQDLFLDYNPLTDPTQVGAITLGPSAASLRPLAQHMALVRGIFVSPNDLGHPFAIQYMSSGRTQDAAPFWTSYFAESSTKDAYAVTNVSLKTGTLPKFPMLFTDVLRGQIDALNGTGDDSMMGLYQDPSLGVNSYIDFLSQKNKLSKFMDVYSKAPTDTNGKVSDADIIAASLYSDLARAAQLDLQPIDGLDNLDTHGNHATNHKKAQTQRWEIISRFLQSLKDLGLLDSTLVAVVTEFNRTPGLNANLGKDHNNSDNVVALFGRGLNGGRVIGDHRLYKRSDGFPYAYWAGKHVDFSTGQVVEVGKGATPPTGVDLIHPGDIWKTVAASFSQDMTAYAAKTDRVIAGIFA